MKDKIYLYSLIALHDFIKNILLDFDILILKDEHINDRGFTNNNIIFVISEEINNSIQQSFFINNTVLVFDLNEQKKTENNKYSSISFLHRPLKIKKFFDSVNTCFFLKTIFFKDIKIIDEKIINTKFNFSCALTPLEKKILIEFIDKKKIERAYFLEKIFKFKKDIETKTIESHLTRIRKKLLIIKSEIQISSKEDIFYIEN